MATDPIRRIREREHEIPLTFVVRDALNALAQLPPSLDVPYLTVSLDWTPEGADPGREPPPQPRPSERRSRRGEIGPNRRPSRRKEELIRLALRTGAEIEFIHTHVPFDDMEEDGIPEPRNPSSRTEAAAILDEIGGVGAQLRFAMA
jgi:hypothetical protein